MAVGTTAPPTAPTSTSSRAVDAQATLLSRPDVRRGSRSSLLSTIGSSSSQLFRMEIRRGSSPGTLCFVHRTSHTEPTDISRLCPNPRELVSRITLKKRTIMSTTVGCSVLRHQTPHKRINSIAMMGPRFLRVTLGLLGGMGGPCQFHHLNAVPDEWLILASMAYV